MPKQAKEYLILDTDDPQKALKAISFPVTRAQVFCEIDGEKVALPKEAIFRKKPLTYYETLTPDYTVISHQAAFTAMLEALKPFKWKLKGVTLDQVGAQMTARFQIQEPKKVLDDEVYPEITLTNSYNTSTALALHLGTCRAKDENVAMTPSDFTNRWMHLGNKAESEELRKAIGAALQDFHTKIIPMYEAMTHFSATKVQGIEAVIGCVKKNVLPAKWGRFALHALVQQPEPYTIWTVYSALTWATTHGFKGTPTRLMEIQQKIARAFKAGGAGLLSGLPKSSKEEVEKWLQKSVGLVAEQESVSTN